MERFNRDMTLQTFAVRVNEDVVSANQSGVSTIPSFFINDSRYLGGCDFETLLSQIQEVIGDQSSGIRRTPTGQAMVDPPTSRANSQ
jgi:predicted DsbA family dithiol-disulfide isomerase